MYHVHNVTMRKAYFFLGWGRESWGRIPVLTFGMKSEYSEQLYLRFPVQCQVGSNVSPKQEWKAGAAFK